MVEIKEGRNHEASSQTSSATIPGLGCAHAPADGSLEGWDDGVIKDRGSEPLYLAHERCAERKAICRLLRLSGCISDGKTTGAMDTQSMISAGTRHKTAAAAYITCKVVELLPSKLWAVNKPNPNECAGMHVCRPCFCHHVMLWCALSAPTQIREPHICLHAR